MTVLEPTPDRPRHAPLLRRAGFLAAALGLVIAFGTTLSGIATTQGTVQPQGEAAALAAKQVHSTSAHRGSDCPRERERARERGASGRV
jgi:hypothetical protein